MLLTLPILGAQVQTFPLTSAEDLEAHKIKIETVDYKGRKAVRLLKDSPGEGMALLKDIEFSDGTIVSGAIDPSDPAQVP